MREIGHIYLSWRKGPGSNRHIVGRLRRNSTVGISFSYIKEGVNEARKDGFSPYTEFPDLNKTYKDNVIEIFGQRIIRSERSDINDFLDFWEIDRAYKDDKYYLLAHTQGLNPADNFEFLAEYNPVRSLRFLTDLAGLSVTKLSSGSVLSGDELSWVLEKNNKHDPFAVKVLKGELQVGYIKKVHSRVFHKLHGKKLKIMTKAIESNGTIKKIFVKIVSV